VFSKASLLRNDDDTASTTPLYTVPPWLRAPRGASKKRGENEENVHFLRDILKPRAVRVSSSPPKVCLFCTTRQQKKSQQKDVWLGVVQLLRKIR
jgi:hypothetical protein